jgi:hypothetical protein
MYSFGCLLISLNEPHILDKRNQSEQACKVFQDFHRTKSVKINATGIMVRKSTTISPKQKTILDYLDKL